MLEVKHISFSWARRPLLQDVSFSVSPGETIVLAGANGAGKTTLMKVIAGLSIPSSGEVLADGFDIYSNTLRFRRMLGYLPETAAAEADMRVRSYLKFRANLRGEMAKKIRHRVGEAMDLCGLEPYAERRIGALSYGLRKRVALADAVLLRPRILLLDDLLAGLDPVTRGSFGRILCAVSSFSAVLVSGHELEELSQWANKFLVLRDGVVTEAKSVSEVRLRLGIEQPKVKANGGNV